MRGAIGEPLKVNKEKCPKRRAMATMASITAVGPDRGGIVAAFTSLVFEEGGNIEKITQNVVDGVFGMHMDASFARYGPRVGRELERLGGEHGMDVSVRVGRRARSVAVLVTKEPHCLEAVLDKKSGIAGRVSVVVGTEETLRPLARKAGVPFVCVPGKDQRAAESEIISACKKHSVDLILLARYMRILTPNFVWRYPERIINIHPSLLPAFPGALAYSQAFERGVKTAGVTAHYVTENLDQGPIIIQESFNVGAGDTLESVKAKGRRLEAAALLRAARLHAAGRLEVRWRRVHVR